MRAVRYDYSLQFEGKDGERHEMRIITTEGIEEAERQAREKFRREERVSLDTLEELSLTDVSVSYDNRPWSHTNELLTQLAGLDYIQVVQVDIPASGGDDSCLQLLVKGNARASERRIQEVLDEYYPVFTIVGKTGSNEYYVKIDPKPTPSLAEEE